jgi:hypothetical protein
MYEVMRPWDDDRCSRVDRDSFPQLGRGERQNGKQVARFVFEHGLRRLRPQHTSGWRLLALAHL